MSTPSEPRNPLYLLLLAVGVIFVVTALGYAIFPILEQQALEAGEPLPDSPFRDELRQNGGTWILVELAAMVVLGIASMVLDRLRSLQSEKNEGTISSEKTGNPSP